MEDKEIRDLLAGIKIPEPDSEACERALRAALAEFRRQKKKKFKGFSWIGRLMDKKQKGGFSMNRPISITAGVAVSFIAVMITFSLLYFTNKTNFTGTEKKYYFVRSAPDEAPKNKDAVQIKDGVKPDTEIVAAGNSKESKLARSPSQPKMAALKINSQAPNEVGLSAPMFNSDSASYPVGAATQAMRDQEYIGRDKFENFTPNPVNLASVKPVSTFSIDVDTSSYSFVRRALNEGYLPQKDAVRVEEMINYFDYKYPHPEDRTAPFRPAIALFPTPWNPDTKLLHIGIKGFDLRPEVRPRANLVFLIDVSGSMDSPDKLPLLKKSMKMLVDTLDPDDTVAIVVYAGAAGAVLEKTSIKERGKILAAVERLDAGGSTAGGEGIRLAYSLAESGMDPAAVNRVILATDGDFNVGIRDPEVLKDFVERQRGKNIFLSVLGFGQGNYNDALMQKLAQNGNGNAAYIDNLNEARKVLVDEVKGTLFTIAKDVKIQMEFNPAKVAEYRLIGYETRMLNREDFNDDKVDAGDIGSGHTVTALYEITPVESRARLIDDLRYGSAKHAVPEPDKDVSSEYAFLKIRYKLPDENESRLISTPVDSSHEYSALSESPEDSRFAAAVAALGQLLRGDSHVGQYTYDSVIDLARGATGEDQFGYRAEFINLARLAKTASDMGER